MSIPRYVNIPRPSGIQLAWEQFIKQYMGGASGYPIETYVKNDLEIISFQSILNSNKISASFQIPATQGGAPNGVWSEGNWIEILSGGMWYISSMVSLDTNTAYFYKTSFSVLKAVGTHKNYSSPDGIVFTYTGQYGDSTMFTGNQYTIIDGNVNVYSEVNKIGVVFTPVNKILYCNNLANWLYGQIKTCLCDRLYPYLSVIDTPFSAANDYTSGSASIIMNNISITIQALSGINNDMVKMSVSVNGGVATDYIFNSSTLTQTTFYVNTEGIYVNDSFIHFKTI
jgi:hypothetical protein